MRDLELLAPARNADIGIAAIDCGADAVYIAGPAFGARQAAGNSMEDVRRLCEYAHRFGVRIFLTINTILYDGELEEALRLKAGAAEAGVDALIVQDLAMLGSCCGKVPAAPLQMLRGPVLSRTDDGSRQLLRGPVLSRTDDGSRQMSCSTVLSPQDGLPLHASTQCAIRTPEKARLYESLGFSRLVLERELSLEQVRAIREAVSCELEFFVHGALCVCYSGQCYLSEAIAGRSANRGACIQACRSLYDLADETGRVLVKDKALLSLKDYQLLSRVGDLADAGIDSFKIEGRLKNISYVRNVVRAYSLALDQLVARHPESYRRASFGRISGGFTPDLNKTFNRGYTELFLDGRRPDIPAAVRPGAPASSPDGWSSMDAPTSLGEYVGTVTSFRNAATSGERVRSALSGDGRPHGQNDLILTLRPAGGDVRLKNGDGFSFVAGSRIVGFRGDVCTGETIRCKDIPEMFVGARLFRNVSTAFEKELETNLPARTLPVEVKVSVSERDGAFLLTASARSEDGRSLVLERDCGRDVARQPERMVSLFRNQFQKTSGIYSFTLASLQNDTREGRMPFLPVSVLNGFRRDLAAGLDALPCGRRPLAGPVTNGLAAAVGKSLTYKENVANVLARTVYRSLGAETVEDAFELARPCEAELMRTKYCIRHELGLCPVHQLRPTSGTAPGPVQGSPSSSSPSLSAGRTPASGATPAKALFLLNNGQRYALHFDCRRCEMTVSKA